MLSSILRNVTFLVVFTVAAIFVVGEVFPPIPENLSGEAGGGGGALTKAAAVAPARRPSPEPEPYYGGQTLALDAGPGGHFFVDASIRFEPIRFLVDTGASLVALTRADAERIGFDVDRLDYRYRVSTANGTARVARVMLDEVVLGDIVVEQVPAAVVEGGLDTSLLGMSFLNRLSSFEVRDDRLILRW